MLKIYLKKLIGTYFRYAINLDEIFHFGPLVRTHTTDIFGVTRRGYWNSRKHRVGPSFPTEDCKILTFRVVNISTPGNFENIGFTVTDQRIKVKDLIEIYHMPKIRNNYTVLKISPRPTKAIFPRPKTPKVFISAKIWKQKWNQRFVI